MEAWRHGGIGEIMEGTEEQEESWNVEGMSKEMERGVVGA
jgi:hypothetical protein